MTDREDRIAKNEAVSREINEGIEEAMSSVSPEGYWRMLCECGTQSCDRRIAIAVAEYEDARKDPRRFVVAEEHVIPDVERIVAKTERYVLVEKREGEPAGIAEESDPRD